jgi:hypothetical protein
MQSFEARSIDPQTLQEVSRELTEGHQQFVCAALGACGVVVLSAVQPCVVHGSCRQLWQLALPSELRPCACFCCTTHSWQTT